MSYLRGKTRTVLERGARDRAATRFWQSAGQAGGIPRGLRVVSPAAWMIGAIVYVQGALLLYWVAIPRGGNDNMAHWATWQKLLFSLGLPLLCFLLVLLYGYIYGDAKRRRMRYIMWTLLAIFVPNLIGVLLYFLLRDPLPAPCPACGKIADGNYAFCPHCGTSLALVCPQCHRVIEVGWENCAYCGTKLNTPQAQAG
jgi:RNA polymerase subunit RPABC4/transcription elongation factor Spt4